MHQKTSNSKTIFLVGCGGHARSVADIVLQVYPDSSIVFLDKHAKKNETIWGFPCLPLPNQAPPDTYIIALGNNQERKNIYETFDHKNLISMISPLAHINKTAKVGIGSSIGNFCHVGPEATISNNTIINNGAIIEHETSIGNHCHIAPGATISGRTKISDSVFIGTGASVINKIEICSNVIVGAGATVVKNITQPGTYIGTPAKKIE